MTVTPATSRRPVEWPAPADRTSTLGWATAGVLLLDGVGGSFDVAFDSNTPASAWGGGALAAAPSPGMAAQAALAVAAARWHDRR